MAVVDERMIAPHNRGLAQHGSASGGRGGRGSRRPDPLVEYMAQLTGGEVDELGEELRAYAAKVAEILTVSNRLPANAARIERQLQENPGQVVWADVPIDEELFARSSVGYELGRRFLDRIFGEDADGTLKMRLVMLRFDWKVLSVDGAETDLEERVRAKVRARLDAGHDTIPYGSREVQRAFDWYRNGGDDNTHWPTLFAELARRREKLHEYRRNAVGRLIKDWYRAHVNTVVTAAEGLGNVAAAPVNLAYRLGGSKTRIRADLDDLRLDYESVAFQKHGRDLELGASVFVGPGLLKLARVGEALNFLGQTVLRGSPHAQRIVNAVAFGGAVTATASTAALTALDCREALGTYVDGRVEAPGGATRPASRAEVHAAKLTLLSCGAEAVAAGYGGGVAFARRRQDVRRAQVKRERDRLDPLPLPSPSRPRTIDPTAPRYTSDGSPALFDGPEEAWARDVDAAVAEEATQTGQLLNTLMLHNQGREARRQLPTLVSRVVRERGAADDAGPFGTTIDYLVARSTRRAEGDLTVVDIDPSAMTSAGALRGRVGRRPAGAEVNPNPGYQSSHPAPVSAMRDLPGYNPGENITRLLPTGKGQAHTVFDKHWEAAFRAMPGDTVTAAELLDVMTDAALHSGAFSRAEADSIIALVVNDLFLQRGLEPGTVLRKPGAPRATSRRTR